MNWKFLPIAPDSKVDSFDCEVEPLNHFLKTLALANQKGRLGTTIVAVPEQGQDDRVVGYYTVSPAEISFSSLSKDKQHGPRQNRGAMRIGRLAVDKSAKGKGLGRDLLIEALKRATRINNSELAIYAVIVDAKDGAEGFYKKFGFIPYQDIPTSLFLPMKTILGLNL